MMLPLFDLTLQFFGFPIKKAQEDLQKIKDFSAAAHVVFLENQKREIVAFHQKNNLFYQNLTSNLKEYQWEDLPVLTKKDLQIPLHKRLSNGYTLQKVYKNKTSGSSGEPFFFAKDKFCHALTWASNQYRFGWFGINFNQDLQARFYGIPLDFFGYQKERFKDFLSHRYRFPVFDLSDPVLDQFLSKFKQKKFVYINGYTSSIVLFAKYLQSKNIVLTTVCPTLKLCVVTSEMLFESDKILMQTQFGVPVVNEYGASELDLIAFENPQNQWQVNAETLFVEILDDQNRVLEYGKEGRIVVTSLFNKAHPFIRYDLGDIGVLDPKSSSQKPILKQLTGRTNDFAVLPSGKKAAGLAFYYITKAVIEDDGNVKEFVIVQTKIDTFELLYRSEVALSLLQIQKIKAAIELYLEPNLNFIFIKKTVLSRSNRGKLKQFSSRL